MQFYAEIARFGSGVGCSKVATSQIGYYSHTLELSCASDLNRPCHALDLTGHE